MKYKFLVFMTVTLLCITLLLTGCVGDTSVRHTLADTQELERAHEAEVVQATEALPAINLLTSDYAFTFKEDDKSKVLTMKTLEFPSSEDKNVICDAEMLYAIIKTDTDSESIGDIDFSKVVTKALKSNLSSYLDISDFVVKTSASYDYDGIDVLTQVGEFDYNDDTEVTDVYVYSFIVDGSLIVVCGSALKDGYTKEGCSLSDITYATVKSMTIKDSKD